MSIDYLEDLENAIDRGVSYFACPGTTSSEWHIASSLDELRQRAQRSANALKHDVHLFRIINKADVTTGDCFLVVKKILERGKHGEPRMQWVLVDTKEAAEMVRDVSQGPSPFFGATIQETFKPQ
ncbi:MAG TPA: hypothetical protein PLP17_04625 [Oligoflexia bacterium]|nr:hypothetical protein [Oligoflexia bacterium]